MKPSPLSESTHPFLEGDFSPAWSQLSPDHVQNDISEALRIAQSNIDSLCALSEDEITYENTFLALEKASELLNRGWGRLMHLDSVCDNEAQREAIGLMLPEVVTFSSSLILNPALWTLLQKAAQKLENTPLSPTQKRHITETLKDFQESGAALPLEKKQRVAEINNELSLLTKDFSEKVLDATNEWELIVEDEKETAGLPPSALAAALASAQSKGLGSPESPVWRFTQHYPSMAPVMQFAHSESLRQKVWEGANALGTGKFDTQELIEKILTLRDQKARLLGFAHHADFTTSRRMAGSGTKALSFIEDLHQKVAPAYLEEMETLRLYKEKKTGASCPLLAPWEIAYWSELQRKELYDFDEEELRPYFNMSQVMQGMFELVSTLFGIEVKQEATFYQDAHSPETCPEGATEVWHPEVSFYALYDQKTGDHLGSFYTDWHPRESKRGGAWMNSLVTGSPAKKGQPRRPHLGLMCGNMTPPLGDKPALLTHREVETIFHEFGHLLHHLLSDVEVASLAGTNVAWDFVELPSQIMENWCWEKEALNSFALHVESQEAIPEALFDKMLRAKNYQSACAFMRQLTFGKLDLELHLHPEKYIGRPLEEVDEEILSAYRVPLLVKGKSVARRMTHLFSDPVGYSAGYYSYKWAEVLDADAFTRFQKEGVLNPQTGADFRAHILSQGSSRPAEELYEAFMGRAPELEPLLARSGLLS